MHLIKTYLVARYSWETGSVKLFGGFTQDNPVALHVNEEVEESLLYIISLHKIF
jgi:hypothetical protein